MKRHVAYFGLLLALALILSYVESLIPVFVSVPGIKLGLANLVVLLCLYIFPAKYALLLSVARVLLAGFLFGNLYSILYSLAGALVSFFVMYLAKKVFKFGILGVSSLGGVFHNMAQMAVAMVVVSNVRIGYLFPYLFLAGVIMGAIIGIFANTLVPYLRKHL